MATKRQKAMADAITALAPQMPFADAEAIRPRLKRSGMRHLPASTAVWLCTIAHIRHAYTDYDELLAEGYGRDAARFFILDATNEKLQEWQSTRFLTSEEDLTVIDQPNNDDNQEAE